MGKKLIILLIFTFVLSACTSKRVVTKEHAEYERQENIVSDSVAFRFDDIVRTSRISRIDTSNFDFRIEFELFDTDKSINDCGQYPVKAKGTITGTQRNTIQDIMDMTDTTHTVAAEHTSEVKNVNDNGSVTKDERKRTRNNNYYGIAFFLLAAVGTFITVKKIIKI